MEVIVASKLDYNPFSGLTIYLYRSWNPFTKYHGHPSSMVLSSSILHPFVGLQRLPLSSVGCGCSYASVVVSKGAALLKLGRSLDWLICNGFLVKLPEPHNIQILYKCDTDQVKAFLKNRMSVALKKNTGKFSLGGLYLVWHRWLLWNVRCDFKTWRYKVGTG